MGQVVHPVVLARRCLGYHSGRQSQIPPQNPTQHGVAAVALPAEGRVAPVTASEVVGNHWLLVVVAIRVVPVRAAVVCLFRGALSTVKSCITGFCRVQVLLLYITVDRSEEIHRQCIMDTLLELQV